jgi:hypothetical protein
MCLAISCQKLSLGRRGVKVDVSFKVRVLLVGHFYRLYFRKWRSSKLYYILALTIHKVEIISSPPSEDIALF